MARIVKEYEVRRTEILDVAQQLFYQKGYEQTSIQDILHSVGIAKGTFYHYFDSKETLLKAFIERMIEQIMGIITPIATDTQLNACQKLGRLFVQAHHWKFEHRAVLLQVLGVFYQEENLRLRHALLLSSAEQIVPVWAQIIEQGVQEGVFTTPFAQEAAEILFKLLQSLSETVAFLILSPPEDATAILEHKVVAYQQAVERILGAPPGALPLFDVDLIKRWLE
ncbi:MAG: TetR/AcrR family transcriptional regulator [Caldilineaceae bacterium]